MWRVLWLTALAIAQGSLYAGGNEWTSVGPGGSFWEIIVDPQNPGIFYATTSGGLFKSEDGGASWDNAGLNGFTVYSLVVDPQHPDVLYAAATNSRQDEDTVVNIIKSTDGGSSWKDMSSGLPVTFYETAVSALGIDPQNTRTLFASECSGSLCALFKSTDGGAHWVGRKPGVPAFIDNEVVAMAVDPQSPNTVYAAIAPFNSRNGGLWKSVDGGANWRTVFPSNVYALAIDPRNATFFFGTDDGLARSTDGGDTWARIPGRPRPRDCAGARSARSGYGVCGRSGRALCDSPCAMT